MTASFLEHLNVTVSDPDRTAKMLCELFGWHIRWHGASLNNGRTVHVGSQHSYLALYTGKQEQSQPANNYNTINGLNHVGIVVADLDDIEKRVKGAGFATTNHGDYEPGRRFYFHDHDNIEFEVVSYESD